MVDDAKLCEEASTIMVKDRVFMCLHLLVRDPAPRVMFLSTMGKFRT